MTNGEKHIEKLLSWYKEAVTENGVCYLTCDDKNTLAYAIKCCKHFEDIKKDIDSWMLREESSSSEKPNKSEIPTGSTTKNDLGIDCISREQAIRELKESAEHHANDSREEALLRRDRDIIKALPPVTPIRPKGHWIYDYISADGHRVYHCSECGCYLKPKTSEYLSDYKWCSLCGAEMKESEEE